MNNTLVQTLTSGKKNLLKDNTLVNASIYDAQYVKQRNVDMQIDEVELPASTTFKWNDPNKNLILIVLDGKMVINSQKMVGKDMTVVAPAGEETSFTVDGENAIHGLVMIREQSQTHTESLIVRNIDKPWIPYIENGHVHLYLKNILTPNEIGGCVMLLDYPAGHITEWHDHEFTHAAYIEDGVFVNESQFDQVEKYYGPGSFVCGPKGQVMRHGAAPEQNCHCYFLTDQPFALHYLSKDYINKVRRESLND